MCFNMAMTSREIVKSTIRFNYPDRLAFDLPEVYGSDFMFCGMAYSPDARPLKGTDEWGAAWNNIGDSFLGEVKKHPLENWNDFERLKIPDINEPARWEALEGIREKAGDKFLVGYGLSIYERIHFLRGLENTWMDIYDAPGKLCKLLDILLEMNLTTIDKYSKYGVDAYFFGDDWGLQNTLMISPSAFREIWKPYYSKIFKAAHNAGMSTMLHSCGYIVDIVEDFIEIGLDVLQIDQQENMGLELIGDRFGGRITFYSPVDIQKTMFYETTENIRLYCRNMCKYLGRKEGGFIAKWYGDPIGAGHSQEALDAMCDEFLKISKEKQREYGRSHTGGF